VKAVVPQREFEFSSTSGEKRAGIGADDGASDSIAREPGENATGPLTHTGIDVDAQVRDAGHAYRSEVTPADRKSASNVQYPDTRTNVSSQGVAIQFDAWTAAEDGNPVRATQNFGVDLRRP
jgi:hypothetical protein